MSRIGWVLIALLSVLLIVGWFFLVYQPTSEDIEAVRSETDLVETQAAQERARAAELRQIRESAPESEAALAAGQLLIPEDAAIPSLFRQMQQAADDAGVRLISIAPSAPAVQSVNETIEVGSIGVSMALEGSYFQIVDLVRRIEDPRLTSRALIWTSASMSPSEFPTLTVTLSGDVYSRGAVELVVEVDDATDDEAEDVGGTDVDPLEDDENLEVEP